jgi:hypothetical protein
MGDKWEKGKPVNLSDLLKITPVANEILCLRGELSINPSDLLWIVSEIVDGSEEIAQEHREFLEEEHESVDRLIGISEDEEEEDELWDLRDFDEELESEADDAFEQIDESDPDVIYAVSVKVQGRDGFPDMGFKAGIKQKDDLRKFLHMVAEMIEKFESN